MLGYDLGESDHGRNPRIRQEKEKTGEKERKGGRDREERGGVREVEKDLKTI